MTLLILLAALLAFWALRAWFAHVDRQTRAKLVAIVSREIEFVPVRADDVDGLNRAGLGALTREMEALGFEHQVDYRIRQAADGPLQGFARLFVHPQERCFAEIMVAGAVAPEKPMFVAINSHLQWDWSIGTSNVEPLPAHYFMRLPRTLRMRYPDDSVSRLLARHVERRREVMAGLGIDVIDDLTTEFYFAKVTAGLKKQRTAMENVSPLRDLAAANEAAQRREDEWLGDYPAEAAKRRAAETAG